MEEKIKNFKEKYRLITESANDIISIINENFELEYQNEEATYNILGYTNEEILRQSALERTHPDEVKSVIKVFREGFKKGEAQAEIRSRHKDGHYVWFDIKGRTFIDEQGQKKGIIISRDITERKNTEQKLVESEEKFRQISEQALLGIAIIQDGQIKYINNAALAVNEYTREEVLSWKDYELFKTIHPDDIQYMMHKLKEYDMGEAIGITRHFTFRVVSKSGDVKWVELTTNPIIYQGKNATVNFSSEITERKKVEQKLKESEEKYRTITEQFLMGIVIMQDDIFKYANEGFSTITEYPVEEVMNWTTEDWAKTVHPEDLQTMATRLKDRAAGKKDMPLYVIFRIITKSGRIKWVESFGKDINYNGRIATYSALLDVTDKKEAEEKLKESEEQFRKITEKSLTGIAITQDGIVKYVNETIADLIEYSIQEILDWEQNGFINLVYPDDRTITIERLRKIDINSERTPFFLCRLVTKSGSIKHVNINSKQFLFKGKEAILTTFVDLTEKIGAERKLKISETKYRHLFDNSPDMIILTNMEGNFIDVNRAFIEYSEYSKEEIIGKNYSILTELTSPATLPLFIEKHEEIVSNGSCKPVEFQFIDNEGVTTWINFQGHIIELENESLIEVVIRDITARMEARERLKEAFERETFFKNLFTHDINNILNNIQNSLSLFTLYQNNPEKQEEIRKIVNILKEQVVRGTHLVSNIRQLSEIDEEKLPLGSIDAAKVLYDAIKLIQEGFQTRIIDVNIDSTRDPLLVQANELLINVFENILNNAVKYNEHSIVEIIVRISKQYEDGVNYVKFEFMDNGIGIDDLKKATIFKEGYKKEKGGKGLGFGLSLVKKIIAGYKGRIWVEDKIEGNHLKGSNFILLIPNS